MIFNLGYLMLVTALVLAAFGMVAGFLGGAKRLTGGVAASFNAVYAVAALVIGCTLILWYGLTGDHFEVAYVWNHSERALPLFYKFAALWGGQVVRLLANRENAVFEIRLPGGRAAQRQHPQG